MAKAKMKYRKKSKSKAKSKGGYKNSPAQRAKWRARYRARKKSGYYGKGKKTRKASRASKGLTKTERKKCTRLRNQMKSIGC